MAIGSIGGFLPLSGGALAGGTVAAPSLTFGDAGTGFYNAGTNSLGISASGTGRVRLTTADFRFSSGLVASWAGSTVATAADTGLSRVSAGIVAVGNGSAANVTGTLRAAALAAGGSDITVTAVNSVSPTAPNRTITISYGGTTYYVAAKTTND